MNGKLFPTDVPGSEWTTFEAAGFSRPVCGMVYRSGAVMPGMPLGSLGTGFLPLGTDGTLDYMSTIFNAFLRRGGHQQRSEVPTIRTPFLGLSVEGRTRALSLQSIDGLDSVEQIHYWGHYPIADLEFETGEAVEAALRAWTPFFPGHAADSNTPGAVFEVRLRNVSDAAQSGTLALSFRGPDEVRGDARYVRTPLTGGLVGTSVSTTAFGDAPTEYALGIAGGGQVRVGSALGEDADAWNGIEAGLPEPTAWNAWDAGTCIAVDFALEAGEVQTVPFVLAWYAPLWYAEPRQGEQMNRYRHMYANRFESAADVAGHLADNREAWLARVLAWQEAVYAEEALDGWLQDALVNIFHVLAQESFWMTSEDPEHWWGEEGIFTVNESLMSCAQQSCIACDWIGQWPVDLFFPDLSRNNLRVFKHHQQQIGMVPSTLGPGTEPDRLWYGQQISWDGQSYTILVDRLWQRTGDHAVLDEFYESVRSNIIWMQTVDQDRDGLVDVWGNSQYYDNWEMTGTTIHMAGSWLATLRIAERMARAAGDGAFAEECSAWYEKGSASLEEALWNDDTASYRLYHNIRTGAQSDTVLSDQLIGEFFARIHGLPSIFPAERVRTVLGTVERLNVAATPHGIRTSMRPDGTADRTGFYAPLMTPSYSTIVPSSLMVTSGDAHFEELGREIVRRTWRNMLVNQQMTWDMPCMLKEDGTRSWGLEYWHNPMLWAFPIAVLGQDFREFCSDGGLVDRITRAAGA